MISLVTVKDVNISFTQGETANVPVWNAHDGYGNIVDLSDANGVMGITSASMEALGAFYYIQTFPLTTNGNGNISMQLTSAQTANTPAADYLYNVMLADPTDNSTVVAVSGVLHVLPGIGASFPLATPGYGNTNLYPANTPVSLPSTVLASNTVANTEDQTLYF